MVKCKVLWCKERPLQYKNGKFKVYCSTHNQYKNLASNASSRPWLMYKVEKILDDNFKCESCNFEPIIKYPNHPIKILSSLMDVDHIDPNIKGAPFGEIPSNYQLLCKHCHILKSHHDGDFINKKLK